MSLLPFDVEPTPMPEPARRYGFLISGPNASGKTTTVQRALEPWAGDRRVATAYADNSDRSKFKGDGPTMVAALRELWLGPAPVVVVEGTNRIALKLADVIAADTTVRSCESLMTLMSADVMRRRLIARCEKLGKRFRDDYWTLAVCKAEGEGRYASLGRRLFHGTRYWSIGDDYAACSQLGAYLRERVSVCLGD